MLKAPAPHASLAQPGVLRAALGRASRPDRAGREQRDLRPAGAISAVVGVVFVLPLILLPLGTSIQNSAGKYLPMLMAENSLSAVKAQANALSPGVGFALLCGYATVALAAGGWVLARRDA